MWCPSVSLSVWANAWLAGRAAPDDVLDALSAWAPAQSVAAYDAISIGEAGSAFSGGSDGGAATLLQLMRGAGQLRMLAPIAGDVRGLPAGTEFAADALAVGEAVIVTSADSVSGIGLIPEFTDDDAGRLCWTAYALPDIPAPHQHDLGEAEYRLRSAVRSATETLATVVALDNGPDDPRDLVEQLLEAGGHHRIPTHAPTRAMRVLESAALVDAIVTVGAEAITAGAHSASQAQRADEALAPLAATVRAARAAAVDAILHSAWRG